MQAQYNINDSFRIHFVWKLPNEDFARAIFMVNVTEIQPQEDRYLVQLTKLIAGVQEAPDGTARPQAEYDKQWWANIVALQSRYIQIAYEAADGRPLYMRLPTLTSEHTFFFRYDEDGKKIPAPEEEQSDAISD